MFMRRIDDVLVWLVHDDERIVLFRQRQNFRQLGPGKHLAGRIRRIAHDNGLGLLGKSPGQFRRIVPKVGCPQRHINWLGPRKDRVSRVVLVERREHDDPIARITGRHHGHHHGFGTAAGDDEMAFGIHLQTGSARNLPGQCLPETRGSPRDGILMEGTSSRPFQGGQ